MIRHEFILSRYDWKVTAFIVDQNLYEEFVLDALEDIDYQYGESAIDILIDSGSNAGFTISVPQYRSSVLLIGTADSAEEFFSTLDHEKVHLGVHISLYSDIDLTNEEFAYLIGDIGKIMYHSCKNFLCEDCRKYYES